MSTYKALEESTRVCTGLNSSAVVQLLTWVFYRLPCSKWTI